MTEPTGMGEYNGKTEQTADTNEQLFNTLSALRRKWAEQDTLGKRFSVPREGKKPVDTLIYRPSAEIQPGQKLPVFLNMHGGAWIGGDAVCMESFCQLLADRIPALVVNVNYTKADVEQLPYAHEEVADTVRYFADHAEEYGIDPDKIMVGGHSAGANLAAGAAWLLREEQFPLFAQVLVYVCSDLTRIPKELTDIVKMLFPNGGEDSPVISPGAQPAEKLKGLAPAIFILCGKDDLRPDGISYASKLIEAGVPVKVKEYADAEHGFLEVNRPDYKVDDPRKTEEQAAYARDCEDYLIREIRAML